mgnify:CR=1 FL=1
MSIGRHAAGCGYGGRVGDPIGVSIGTSNLVAVRVGRAPVSRRAVLTLFGHLPAEVGTPEENGHLPDPDGMVVRGFVERVGDPVPLVVGDGASYRGETLLATALSALLDLVGGAGAGDAGAPTLRVLDALRGGLGDATAAPASGVRADEDGARCCRPRWAPAPLHQWVHRARPNQPERRRRSRPSARSPSLRPAVRR